jgi:D-alanine--poly(phosphoribitol) ligase subunit 2
MSDQNVVQLVSAMLSERFLIDFGQDFDGKTNLFKAGFIDSYGLVELVSFVEDEFKIKVESKHLESDAFVTFDNIVDFIVTNKLV